MPVRLFYVHLIFQQIVLNFKKGCHINYFVVMFMNKANWVQSTWCELLFFFFCFYSCSLKVFFFFSFLSVSHVRHFDVPTQLFNKIIYQILFDLRYHAVLPSFQHKPDCERDGALAKRRQHHWIQLSVMQSSKLYSGMRFSKRPNVNVLVKLSNVLKKLNKEPLTLAQEIVGKLTFCFD